ncbi:DNA-binding response regulator [Streptomyces sp. F001]|uniref:helix-turn-helix transcriptional regulator n=1 Tax=Streptomyces sp. F001 TaxID=1510026 RepID=UPI00101E6A3B|nr:response regulator transcription factor [Streptomyces sp. F001]RZB16036.1 DNA-binding response regulator [Streptomyces sp. F001]
MLGGSLFGRIETVSTLGEEEGFSAAGYAADPGKVQRIITERRPDIAVVFGADALPLIHAVAASTPRPRLLVVSPTHKRGEGDLTRARIAGVVVNRTSHATLMPALRLLRSGYLLIAEHRQSGQTVPVQRRPPWRFDRLTARETEVVQLMLRGWSNVEIAEALDLSEATVKSHVHSLMGKLELKSRIDVITTAYRTGLVRPGSPRFTRMPRAAAGRL